MPGLLKTYGNWKKGIREQMQHQENYYIQIEYKCNQQSAVCETCVKE